MVRNCLSHAFDRLHEVGGYLVFRCSAHWGLPHAMHFGEQGLSSFVPHRKLQHPVVSLLGFEGCPKDYDLANPLPVPLHGIVIGAWVMAIGATAWVLRRYFIKLKGQLWQRN